MISYCFVPISSQKGVLFLRHPVFRLHRQKLGAAIGTKFAPAYAHLFMTRLEERLLDASPDNPLV